MRPVDPAADEAYGAFLRTMPDALLYYSAAYAAFLEDLLGCPAHYLAAWQNGRIAGVLPLMRCDGPWGAVLNSLPYYGSNGGALAASAEAGAALTEAFEAAAAAPGVAAATWIAHPRLAPPSRIVSHQLTDRRVGQFTDLTAGGDALFRAIDGSARRNINKALASGVAVAIENDQLAFLEATHRANMAEIGGNAKSPDFFAKFPRHFAPDSGYRLYVARRGGKPVAALLLFYFNRTVEYFTPATDAAEREHQPMAALLHRAMTDAIAAGYAWWNWGGTWLSQTGVYRFKRKWGAVDFPYAYYVTLNDRSLLARKPDQLMAGYPGFYVVPFGSLENR